MRRQRCTTRPWLFHRRLLPPTPLLEELFEEEAKEEEKEKEEEAVVEKEAGDGAAEKEVEKEATRSSCLSPAGRAGSAHGCVRRWRCKEGPGSGGPFAPAACRLTAVRPSVTAVRLAVASSAALAALPAATVAVGSAIRLQLGDCGGLDGGSGWR